MYITCYSNIAVLFRRRISGFSYTMFWATSNSGLNVMTKNVTTGEHGSKRQPFSHWTSTSNTSLYFLFSFFLCFLQQLRSTEGLCEYQRRDVKVPESWFSGGRVLREGPWNVFFRLWGDPRPSTLTSCFVNSPRYHFHTISAAPVYLPHPTRCISDMISPTNTPLTLLALVLMLVICYSCPLKSAIYATI